MLDANHGRARNVSSGEQLDAVVVDGDLVLPIENEKAFIGNGVAFAENVGVSDGGDDFFVSRKVIGMSVGDEGERARTMRIEPQSQRGKRKGTRMEVERHGGELNHRFHRMTQIWLSRKSAKIFLICG